MNNSILYTVFYNDNIYHCVGNNIKKILKEDYCFITNRGNLINPYCTYHKKNDSKEHTIGGLLELVDFISKNDSKFVILKGFSRAQSQVIYRSVQERNVKYKLYGTMNIFNLVPDFVYPVFECNGKYYFQKNDNHMTIDSFDEICGEEHTSRIKPLSSSFNRLVNIKDYYRVGDESVIAFQTSDDKYFIGNRDAFNEFIKDIKIDDEILLKNISEFQSEIKLARTLEKK